MKKSILYFVVILMLTSFLWSNTFQVTSNPNPITTENPRDEVWLHWDNGTNNDAIGLTDGGTFYVAAKWDNSDLADYDSATLETIKVFIYSETAEYTLKVWTGTNASNEIMSMPLSDYEIGTWNEFTPTESIVINSNESLWIGYEVTHSVGDYAAGCDAGPAVVGKGDKISMDGSSWENLSGYGLDYNWNIQAMIQTGSYEHDVKITQIEPFAANMNPEEPVNPQVQIKNIGLNEETVSVNLSIIDLDGNEEYNETVTDITIAPNELSDVDFPTFVMEENQAYTVNAEVNLDNDENETNNQSEIEFTTYTGERELVLIEEFTGTWCGFCPGAAMAMEDFIENDNYVAIVAYHDGDEFENDYAANRVDYYGITGFPTCIFDGTENYVGGSSDQSIYSALLPIYEEMIQIKTPIELNTYLTEDDGNYSVHTTVYNNGQLPEGNYVLHVAVTESEIPHSWGGLNQLDFVERTMAPNANGSSIELTQETIENTVDFEVESNWNLDHTKVIIWLQETASKKIYQAEQLDITNVSSEEEQQEPVQTLLTNYPNPFYSPAGSNENNIGTTISFNIPSHNTDNLTLEIFDIKGRLVKRYNNIETNTAGQGEIHWNGLDNDGKRTASGIYFSRIKGQNFQKINKMILLK